MSRKKQTENSSVKILPISIIVFAILAIIALFIILNKGTIGGYSLVKIETSSDLEEAGEGKMEISVEKKYLSAKDDEETEISVLIDGEPVELSEIELKSSNEDVLEIEDRKARAVAVGKATITAQKGNMEATAELHVITPIKSISFTSTSSTIRVGKELQMKLIAKPSDANIETLKYESSDEEIATVNSNGIVTGIAPGKVTITVTDTYSGIEKSVNLTIKK